jgi:hypothetical protein
LNVCQIDTFSSQQQGVIFSFATNPFGHNTEWDASRQERLKPTRQFTVIAILGVVAALCNGLLLAPCDGQVTLSWDPSPSPIVAGYYLCWGASSGVYTWTNAYPATLTSATLTNLVDGQVYFFAAQAFLSDGTVSPYSNVAILTTGQNSTNAAPSTNTIDLPSLTGAVPSGHGEYGQASTLVVTQLPSQSGNVFAFSWNATPNQIYQVQWKTDPNQNVWSNLGYPIVATNSTATVSLFVSNPQMFFRTYLLSP